MPWCAPACAATRLRARESKRRRGTWRPITAASDSGSSSPCGSAYRRRRASRAAWLSESLRIGTPVCLDETLTSAAVARQVIDLEGPRVWNIKVHRMGGLAEVCRVYAQAAAYEAELWVGTMPETGIGSQAALAVAGLPLCVYPSDLEPSSRWYGRDADVIKLTMSKDGRMAVPGVSVARLLDVGRFRAAAHPIVA